MDNPKFGQLRIIKKFCLLPHYDEDSKKVYWLRTVYIKQAYSLAFGWMNMTISKNKIFLFGEEAERLYKEKE